LSLSEEGLTITDHTNQRWLEYQDDYPSTPEELSECIQGDNWNDSKLDEDLVEDEAEEDEEYAEEEQEVKKDWLEYFKDEAEIRKCVARGLGIGISRVDECITCVTVYKGMRKVVVNYKEGDYGKGAHSGVVNLSEEGLTITDNTNQRWREYQDMRPTTPEELSGCLQDLNWSDASMDIHEGRAFQKGDWVEIFGLITVEGRKLNGTQGEVVNTINEKGRIGVKIDDVTKDIKKENLWLVEDTS